MIGSCRQQQLEILQSKSLDFPSASAIEFYRDKLYVFGDDATSLLILSTNYKILDTIRYWPEFIYRIPRDLKPDIESSFIMNTGGTPTLFGVSSMSDARRWNVYRFPLNGDSLEVGEFFLAGSTMRSREQVNIEGSCIMDSVIVLANRANTANEMNELLFWDGKTEIIAKPLNLPKGEIVAGISGLYYDKNLDLLLFTASEENTPNAFEDGEIGESYIGWINEFSTRLTQTEFKPDSFLKLSDADERFAKQKIESVCIESVQNNKMMLHLVSDDDKGRSGLFKVALTR